MGNKMFETVMGALVLAVAATFMMFAYQSSNLKTVEGYTLKGKFTSITGVALGTDVRIGGIKVGVVSDLELDSNSYQAVVTMQIKNSLKLPKDSSAAIATDGLLGGKYVKLEPGADDQMLAANDFFPHTQSAIDIGEIIGKLAFGGVDGKSSGSSKETPKDAAVEKSSPPTIK